MTRQSRVAALASWLTDLLSMSLDEHEREVVRGDLTECHADEGRALREMVGIVLRRQAALWSEWRPWLTVISIVLPIGMLLSHAARWWGVGTALDVVLYWTLWDFSYLNNPGWRADLVRTIFGASMAMIALIGWSWTSGFVVSRVSRRATWATLTLLIVVVFAGTLGTLPIAEHRSTMPALQHYGVFTVSPRLMQTFLVVIPALFGAWRGHRQNSLRLGQTIIAVVLLAGVSVLASRGLEEAVVFGRGVMPGDPGPDGYVVSEDDPRPLWPLSLVVMWPAAYVATVTSWQRWRAQRALA